MIIMTKQEIEEYNKMLEGQIQKLDQAIQNFGNAQSRKLSKWERFKFYATCWLPATRYSVAKVTSSIYALSCDILKLNKSVIQITQHLNKMQLTQCNCGNKKQEEGKDKGKGGMFQ